MNPNNECDFGRILECFHEDFHRSDQTITRQEDTKSLEVFREIIANYVPHLTETQWIKVLGELVAGMYADLGVPMRGQSTTPFTITA